MRSADAINSGNEQSNNEQERYFAARKKDGSRKLLNREAISRALLVSSKHRNANDNEDWDIQELYSVKEIDSHFQSESENSQRIAIQGRSAMNDRKGGMMHKRANRTHESMVVSKGVKKRSGSLREITKSEDTFRKETNSKTFFSKAAFKTKSLTDIMPMVEEVKAGHEEAKGRVNFLEHKGYEMGSKFSRSEGEEVLVRREPTPFAREDGFNQYKPFTYNMIHAAIGYHIHLKGESKLDDS
eukprot:TRINITY_DN10772_c0_g5_i1.p1 TRINITY_DN10772_c0_g5~~TRINITY_DN10772_c0_g5_i1.p1  ORF type:complete len:242 (-),score=37.64 TRINITY_DN10772_c0_g5_i1:197-922(-)